MLAYTVAGVNVSYVIGSLIAAIPAVIAALRAGKTNTAVDTGNGMQIGEAVYSLHAKVDSLAERVEKVENKVGVEVK